MRPEVRVLVVAAASALLVGCAPWHQYAAPEGITFRAPRELKWQPAAGDGGLLAAYGCSRYQFSISWSSYGAPRDAGAGSLTVPMREIEVGEGYGEPWPYGAALHVSWLRPTPKMPAFDGFPVETLRADGRPDMYRQTIPAWSGDGEYRVLHFSGSAKTARDRDVLLGIFRSVRFSPW